MHSFDPLRTPYRPDIADISLKGKVHARNFVEGVEWMVASPSAPLYRTAHDDIPMETELMFGESFRVLEESNDNGWFWGQSVVDDYVGYIRASQLGKNIFTPTHKVSAARTLIYPESDIKTKPIAVLGMNSQVEVVGDFEPFVQIRTGGFIVAAHLISLDSVPEQSIETYITQARCFCGTPYLWGGRGILGIDCSALVQQSFSFCGKKIPRNADMQAREVGQLMRNFSNIQAGDLVFWQGHVGVMLSEDIIIHASAYHMAVAEETLKDARERIEETNIFLCIKRLEGVIQRDVVQSNKPENQNQGVQSFEKEKKEKIARAENRYDGDIDPTLLPSPILSIE